MSYSASVDSRVFAAQRLSRYGITLVHNRLQEMIFDPHPLIRRATQTRLPDPSTTGATATASGQDLASVKSEGTLYSIF